ncbi:efflux RND transporter periplasmic adaptor subunit [Dickeya fangzhongdai]|uniref:efflux RND transporter periplasmic adaptor subunit n=1 Tax=Dickeya fangzhongdai TaxID=1778540 RepID=UPI0004F8FB68|nr:efflux RND transporter periplasmic adaptor subunit [Dickeya fangzhongdai]AIR69303.1 cobalt transporter [Dickeya fangzhongdai]KGT96350.1 cobalt transporter [Dickeya fangzhongdai]
MKLLRSRPFIVASLMVGAVILYFLYSRQSAVSATPHSAPVPLVSLVPAQVKSLPLTLATQGHVVSLNQVDIQSQITGTVKSVEFKEGDVVHQGQLLFTLDDNTQQTALHRAVASQAESRSLLDKAQRDLNRGRALKAQNYISASDWDALQSARQQYDAQFNAARDDIRSAQAQLGYTRIYAPVNGKTGALNVHPGSLVQPGSSLPLVTVSQFDPIGVSFTLPEKDLNSVLAAQAQGPVRVWVNNAKGQPVEGVLDFINNTVSTESGTIALKARFSNAGNLLWPGAYQAVNIDAGAENVVVLPPQAIQNGPDGHFVYIVDKQSQAVMQPVNLLRIQQQMAVVDGISQGTDVVIEGANNLRPGMKVAVAKKDAAGQN